jgi:PST family polysaccharide transporter
MVLARLLSPKDFGLVGMVTVFTGVLTLFQDFGLSSAAVERANRYRGADFDIIILDQHVAWSVAWAGSGSMAPAIAAFYHKPRLLWGDGRSGGGISFQRCRSTALRALQRQMRFTVLAVISVVSLIVATAIAIGGAIAGYEYWALVAMTITQPLVATIA